MSNKQHQLICDTIISIAHDIGDLLFELEGSGILASSKTEAISKELDQLFKIYLQKILDSSNGDVYK